MMVRIFYCKRRTHSPHIYPDRVSDIPPCRITRITPTRRRIEMMLLTGTLLVFFFAASAAGAFQHHGRRVSLSTGARRVVGFCWNKETRRTTRFFKNSNHITRHERIQRQQGALTARDDDDGTMLEHERKRLGFPVWEEWPMETEAKPRRMFTKTTSTSPLLQQSWTDWGIQQEQQRQGKDVSTFTVTTTSANVDRIDAAAAADIVEFPSTINDVANAAFYAIAATLYNQQRPDPIVLQNALVGNVHPLGRRPCRNEFDQGRIGIEIDGAKHLVFDDDDDDDYWQQHPSSSSQQQQRPEKKKRNTNGRAIRRVALVLAGKLSQRPWQGFEKEEEDEGHEQQRQRPVAVYFNTIKQALAASHELMLLKRAKLDHQSSNYLNQQNHEHQRQLQTSYDNVTIHCLGQGGGAIPSSFQNNDNPHQQQQRWSSGQTDPTIGLILIVQPADYNHEFRPPGPAIGSIEALQRLVARASLLSLPTIVMSPRFGLQSSDYDGNDNYYKVQNNNQEEQHFHLDQFSSSSSSSSSKASAAIAVSTFGGYEPPRGPNPWILRDFVPPIFSWIGRGLVLENGYRRRIAAAASPSNSQHDEQQRRFREDNDEHKMLMMRRRDWYAGVALVQSCMYKGHSWRLFAAKETKTEDDSSSSLSRSSSSRKLPTMAVNYTYLASTRSGSGRPTRALMRRVLDEFAPPLSSSWEEQK